MRRENVEQGMGMGVGMSEALAGCAGGRDQDCDELVGFVCEPRVCFRAKTADQSEPVDGFTHFFCSHGNLVHEVRTTLGTASLLVVGAGGCDRTNELLPNMPSRHIAREGARERNALESEAHEPLGNIITNHAPPSTKRAAKLRIPIPIPIPCSTFSS